jgi:hypothetical protein
MTFDVFPAKRRQVRKAISGHWRSLAFERRDSLFQIGGIPQDDRGNNQIEPHIAEDLLALGLLESVLLQVRILVGGGNGA